MSVASAHTNTENREWRNDLLNDAYAHVHVCRKCNKIDHILERLDRYASELKCWSANELKDGIHLNFKGPRVTDITVKGDLNRREPITMGNLEEEDESSVPSIEFQYGDYSETSLDVNRTSVWMLNIAGEALQVSQKNLATQEHVCMQKERVPAIVAASHSSASETRSKTPVKPQPIQPFSQAASKPGNSSADLPSQSSQPAATTSLSTTSSGFTIRVIDESHSGAPMGSVAAQPSSGRNYSEDTQRPTRPLTYTGTAALPKTDSSAPVKKTGSQRPDPIDIPANKASEALRGRGGKGRGHASRGAGAGGSQGRGRGINKKQKPVLNWR